MKKLLIITLLISAFAIKASDECNACEQANKFPDRFHFVKAYDHGAPVESVTTQCGCGGINYVGIAGYTNEDCSDYPKSLRFYFIDVSLNNKLEEININFLDREPSKYLYSIESCCYQEEPIFVVAGCPDDLGNVVWIYRGNTLGMTQVAKWGAGFDTHLIYSAAIKCQLCPANGSFPYPYYQIAAVGKADHKGDVTIWILTFDPTTNTLAYQTEYKLHGGDLFKAAWLESTVEATAQHHCLCDVQCPVLSVGGQDVVGEDCKTGNIHNFTVMCNGNINEVASRSHRFESPITLGDPTFKVRQLVWNSSCCDVYPYPFLLAIGDHCVNPEYVPCPAFQTKVIVYWYNPKTGEFKPLAFKDLDGKFFAGQFTPHSTPTNPSACDCRSVTVGGGCFVNPGQCPHNIITLKYHCQKDGNYPVEMREKAFASFNSTTTYEDVITSLAFCPEAGCWDMIVTSEKPGWHAEHSLDPLCPVKVEKGEIGVFKVYFCKPHHKPCHPRPICARKSVKEIPCRKR